jgi:glyceraldehyde-3-phosphate dehydrogenase/erythrose-4-phosphate dehydrogenase
MADYTTDEALEVLADEGYTDAEAHQLLVHLATMLLDSSVAYTDQFNVSQAIQTANRTFVIERNAGGDMSALDDRWYAIAWYNDNTKYATVLEVANRLRDRFTQADHAGFRTYGYWANIGRIVDRLWPS